jgi:ferredoxin-type protein NapH
MSWPRLRRVTQVAVISGLFAIPVLGLLQVGGPSGTLCAVGWGPMALACPLGAAGTMLAQRSFDAGLALSALPWIVIAAVMGRVFCGWVCPQGTLSELGDRFQQGLQRITRIRRPTRLRLPKSMWPAVSVLVVGLVLSFIIGVPVICYICPIGLLARAALSGTWVGQVGGELAIVAVILVAEVFVARRGWCRYLCPLGALYALLASRFSPKVVRDAVACEGCGSCVKVCTMGNSPIRDKVGLSCTQCTDCVTSCPEDALRIGRRP